MQIFLSITCENNIPTTFQSLDYKETSQSDDYKETSQSEYTFHSYIVSVTKEKEPELG